MQSQSTTYHDQKGKITMQRYFLLTGTTGIEPMTFQPQIECSTTELHPLTNQSLIL